MLFGRKLENLVFYIEMILKNSIRDLGVGVEIGYLLIFGNVSFCFDYVEVVLVNFFFWLGVK